ncbi:hypothetical protein Sjap_026054 [Stephania japonica]|uniref:Uncharacterized protein n=1 Tax=Stephania japonica TaxID=461633 RepID=A0AAP0EAN4_9MAGN
MSTDGAARTVLGPPDFQGPPGRTGHRATCGALPALDPTSGEPFQWGALLREKITLPEAPPADVSGLPNVAVNRRVRFRILTRFPFEARAEHAFETGLPRLLGSTNPCASAVHMEPFPLRPSKFSFEYLLLPPRSHRRKLAGLAPGFCGLPPRPPTHRGSTIAPTAGVGCALQRHPFSGLVDSAE